jgi:hypothetical protein
MRESALALIRPFSPTVGAQVFSAQRSITKSVRVAFTEADASPTLLLNRKLVESALPTIEEVEENQVQNRLGESAFLRTEEQAVPVALDYEFAKPMRIPVTEEQVVKKVEEREIVEIVKKEVQTLMSPDSVMQSFSRTDYARIADHVYSNLVRRLVVEKERVGLR